MLQTKTIVFIHGMFVTKHTWNDWVRWFTKRGYTCYAPAWPQKDKSVAELRAQHPNQDEGHVRLHDVVETFAQFIKTLPEPPIIIGHSLGGLVTQILLQRQLGAAGVILDSAPPRGVLTYKWSFWKANWPVSNLLTGINRPVLWTKAQFQYAFADHLSGAALDAAYECVVPQSKRVPLDILSRAGKINYAAKTAPLLFIAGEKDNVTPASLNFSNYKKYRNNPSKTDYKVFPGRRHYLVNDAGWEELATYINNWLDQV